MQYLHQLSRRGRMSYQRIFFDINIILKFYLGTIIFSIHQPSYSIFKLFDTLLIVAAGHCVYHGPANSVLRHFSSIGYVCEEHDNPADFILDVTQGDRPLERIDTTQGGRSLEHIDTTQADLSVVFSNQHDSDKKPEQNARYLYDFYIKSDLYTSIQEEINNQNIKTTNNKQNLVAKSRLSEIVYVSQRTLRNVYRNPTLVMMQTVVTIFFATLVGLIYLQVSRLEDPGVKNRMGATFFIVTNQVMANLSAIELFLKERVLFIHENASGYYHVSTYFIAKLACDLIPLRTIPSILFSCIVYFMIGFQHTVEKFFIFYFAIFITTTCGAAFCFLLSASVEVFAIANLLAAMAFVLMMVFGGFLVEISSVVDFLSWIKWISIFRYSINIININEFSGLTLCKNDTNVCFINGTDIIHHGAHIEYETQWDLWKNFVALGSMTIIFLILAYIQLLRMKKTK